MLPRYWSIFIPNLMTLPLCITEICVFIQTLKSHLDEKSYFKWLYLLFRHGVCCIWYSATFSSNLMTFAVPTAEISEIIQFRNLSILSVIKWKSSNFSLSVLSLLSCQQWVEIISSNVSGRVLLYIIQFGFRKIGNTQILIESKNMCAKSEFSLFGQVRKTAKKCNANYTMWGKKIFDQLAIRHSTGMIILTCSDSVWQPAKRYETPQQ